MQRTVLVLLTILTVSGCNGSRTQPAASDSSPAAGAEQSSMAQGAHEMPRVPMSLADWAKGAKLFENLGNFHRKVLSVPGFVEATGQTTARGGERGGPKAKLYRAGDARLLHPALLRPTREDRVR